jgi:NADH-quinone oxidoreductase subunit I
MAASVVTVDRNLKAGVWPIVKGHLITVGNFFRSLFLRQYSTIEYPEKKRNVSGRYRGIHILTQREDGTPKCVACFMCATVCPAECIFIESGERPENTVEKYCTRFEIDLLRCVYCGFCVDACPEEAIIMSRENDLVGESREELIIDRDRLMARNDIVEHGPGYRPPEHDWRRPVRIAALERLKAERGIVPGMPPEPGSPPAAGGTVRPAPKSS